MEETPITSSNLFYLIPFNPENVSHCNLIVDLYNSPLFIATQGKTSITTTEKAKTYIQNRFLAEYERNGYSTYLVRLKPSAATSVTESVPLGTVALSKGDSKESYLIPDLGFAILPEYCGKGYATESSKLLMSWAKDKLGVSDVFGFTNEENKASRRVMEKLGMDFRGIRVQKCFGPKVTGATYVLPHMSEDLSIYGFMT
jgi:RimJ/RimL family protein N-acetyltransferase